MVLEEGHGPGDKSCPYIYLCERLRFTVQSGITTVPLLFSEGREGGEREREGRGGKRGRMRGEGEERERVRERGGI